MYTLKTALFDLDGTLADTAPDLVYCLNTVLQQNNYPTLEYDDAKTSISKGSVAMIKSGFGNQHSNDQVSIWQKELLDLYHNNICNQTRLFPGVAETLNTLEQNNIRWGVVTNKPAWLTIPLLKALKLFDRSACIVSGDTLKKRKPDPDPILHACKLIECSPNECIYFGDDERDVLSAKAANMPVVIALYGYIHKQETPSQWGTPYSVKNPHEIIPWLQKHTSYNGRTT